MAFSTFSGCLNRGTGGFLGFGSGLALLSMLVLTVDFDGFLISLGGCMRLTEAFLPDAAADAFFAASCYSLKAANSYSSCVGACWLDRSVFIFFLGNFRFLDCSIDTLLSL